MNIGVSYKEINKNNATVLKSGVSLIADELEMLLNLPKYSFFFGNNMGLDLEKYLYLRNKNAVYNLVRDDIMEVLRKYDKVILRELAVVFRESALYIVLTVQVKSTGDLINVPITLEA